MQAAMLASVKTTVKCHIACQPADGKRNSAFLTPFSCRICLHVALAINSNTFLHKHQLFLFMSGGAAINERAVIMNVQGVGI